ncbi:MAG: hypothetical protein WC935_00290 [Thermoleophilia bacterium]
MTTSRDTDIKRVESKLYVLDLYRKWLQDKLGKRAQQQQQPPPTYGGK